MKSFEYYLTLFKRYLAGRGFAAGTVRVYLYAVTLFIHYAHLREKYSAADIAAKDIYDFAEHLQNEESRYGKPFSPRSIQKFLSAVVLFFRFLYRNEYILLNPAESCVFDLSRAERPREIFTRDEINAFLESIEYGDAVWLRNRALFELMYSSGLRVGETAGLNLSDIDLADRVLTVRDGKGLKDRYAPFSKVAAYFLKKYIERGRGELLKKVSYNEKAALFVTRNGRISVINIQKCFKKICETLDLSSKNLTVHSVRHSTATHLLTSGADVRYVQELLGHKDIQTTVRYTHLIMDHLKRAYRSSHPRENDYYEEIDEEYMRDVETLKDEIVRVRLLKGRKVNVLD